MVAPSARLGPPARSGSVFLRVAVLDSPLPAPVPFAPRTAAMLVPAGWHRDWIFSTQAGQLHLLLSSQSQCRFSRLILVGPQLSAPSPRVSFLALLARTTNKHSPWCYRDNRRWNRCVTVEAISSTRVTSMMEWEVQVIPLRVGRPPYQLRPPGAEMPYGPGSGEVLEINYDLADDNGKTNGRGGTITPFYGRSLTELVNELAHRLGNGIDFQNITVFVRAGNLGQLTPLLTDLPHRDDSIDIVVFMVGGGAGGAGAGAGVRPRGHPERAAEHHGDLGEGRTVHDVHPADEGDAAQQPAKQLLQRQRLQQPQPGTLNGLTQ